MPHLALKIRVIQGETLASRYISIVDFWSQKIQHFFLFDLIKKIEFVENP